jgi:hypothetical protein
MTKRDRQGKFVRSTCDLCRRPTRFIGYNRIIRKRGLVTVGNLTWKAPTDYKDVECGVFCSKHGKEWFAARRAEFSYTHRLTRI